MLMIIIACVSLFITILSLVAAYYFYSKSRKEKEPLCLYENTMLEPKKPFRYGEKKIDRITRTHLTFWNNGREPIQKSDIKGCLEIALEPSVEILEAYVAKSSSEVTGFQVSPIGEVGGKPANRVNVTFDFLDKGDGASIEILHTGKKDTKPIFEGAIVGTPKGILVKEFASLRKKRPLVITLLTIQGVILGSLLTLIVLPQLQSYSLLLIKTIGCVLAAINALIASIIVFVKWQEFSQLLWLQYPKNISPEYSEYF